jgi:hypothetical protein
MKQNILLIFLLIKSLNSFGQISSNNNDWENMIKNHPDFLADANLQQDLILKLEHLSNHPISLNNCNEKDLMEIPFVNLFDAQLIIQHRNKNGAFLCIEELVAVHDLKMEQVRWIRHFVFVEKRVFSAFKIKDGNSDLNSELTLTRMLKSSDVELFPNQYFHDLIKFKLKLSENWHLGFNLENDAGEKYTKLKNGVFDFRSFHVYYQGKTRIKRIAFGDYRLHYGQGLGLGLGFAPGKGAQVLNAIRFNDGINKFSSFDENRFFRGMAFSYDFKLFDLDVFCSYKNKNVSLVSDTLLQGSIYETGLHRTESELAKKNKLSEYLVGLHAAFQIKKIKFGLLALHRKLSDNLVEDKAKPYQYWNESASNYFLTGINSRLNYKNLLFASELTFDSYQAHAAQITGLIAFDSKLDFVFLLRDYSKNYNNPFANGMSEWANQNEQGLYFGASYKLTRNLSLSAFCDYYLANWLKYRFPTRKWGLDYFTELKYELRTGLKTGIRIRSISSEENQDNSINPIISNQLRCFLQFKILKNIELLTRYDLNSKSGVSVSNSNLFIEELEWKLKKISFNIRYSIFTSDINGPLLYATESELNGVFGLNTYSGNGNSGFFMLNYSIIKNLKLGLKIAYQESDKLDEIVYDYKVQMRLRF